MRVLRSGPIYTAGLPFAQGVLTPMQAFPISKREGHRGGEWSRRARSWSCGCMPRFPQPRKKAGTNNCRLISAPCGPSSRAARPLRSRLAAGGRAQEAGLARPLVLPGGDGEMQWELPRQVPSGAPAEGETIRSKHVAAAGSPGTDAGSIPAASTTLVSSRETSPRQHDCTAICESGNKRNEAATAGIKAALTCDICALSLDGSHPAARLGVPVYRGLWTSESVAVEMNPPQRTNEQARGGRHRREAAGAYPVQDPERAVPGGARQP